MSSLPGFASRMHVESWGKPGDSTNVLEALPRKLDIKRHSPSILYNWGELQWFTLYSIIMPSGAFYYVFENMMENGAFAALWIKCSIFHNIFKSQRANAPFSIIFSKVFKTLTYSWIFFSFSFYCQTLFQVLSAGVLCTLRVAGWKPTSNHI